jgi:hypothetical protein
LTNAGSALPDAIATGSNFAFSAGNTIYLIEGATGTVKKSIVKQTPTSSPIVDAAGNIYFSSREAAFCVDSAGNEKWSSLFNASQAVDEFSASPTPVLSPAGKVYFSAFDGNIWELDAKDGKASSSSSVGLNGHTPRGIQMGVSDRLFVKMTGIGGPPATRSIGAFDPKKGLWTGRIEDGEGWFPENVLGGFDIGIVAYGYHDTQAETRETIVLDRCGNLSWRVPGAYAWPVVITFDDDLIVQDRVPGGSSGYTQKLRRFSKDGKLKAESAPTDFLRWPLVGADDTLIGVSCDGPTPTVVALNSALRPAWSLPLENGGCPDAVVLDGDGQYLVVWHDDRVRMTLVQTPVPGPADVSWSRYFGRNATGNGWLAP